MGSRRRKLSLNRETLRALTGERLAEVAAGLRDGTLIGCSAGCSNATCYGTSCFIACGALR